MTIADLKAENKRLQKINAVLTSAVYETYWMARRYADCRSTYSPSTVNEVAKSLLGIGMDRKRLSSNGAFFARDGMGRSYDHLSDEEVSLCEEDSPKKWIPDNEQEAFARGYREGARDSGFLRSKGMKMRDSEVQVDPI